MDYDAYNREERYLCSHLFRLLHEPKENYRALNTLLGWAPAQPVRIFCEVALVRDAYFARKSNKNDGDERAADIKAFMDGIVRTVMRQERVESCQLYSELPEELREPTRTHPRQIFRKAKAAGQLDEGELKVYRAIQGMFSAKPDLVICAENQLRVYEAKFTLEFSEPQLDLTRKVAEVWAEHLYADLGFTARPEFEVCKLGLARYDPDVTWEQLSAVADQVYPEDDRTRAALRFAIERWGRLPAPDDREDRHGGVR